MTLQNIFAQRFGPPPVAARPMPQGVMPGQMPVQLPPRPPMQVQLTQVQPMQPQQVQVQTQAAQPMPQNDLRRMMTAR
jgi:hypothetical protein